MEPPKAVELPTQEKSGIIINDIKYSYSITKSEKEKESLIIKLYDPNNISDFYFTYESDVEKLMKDIKFLSLYENLDEMIDSLKEIFTNGNVQVEEKDGIFNMEFKLIGIKKKCIVQLIKHEIEKPKESKSELENKIDKLENKFKDLFHKFEELKNEKNIKENDLRNIVKEVIFDKDIKLKLFEEMEQMLLSKYNLNNLNNIPIDNNYQKDIINKVQNYVSNKEQKINNQIINIEKQLKYNIDYLNNIKSKMINNYITLQVNIDKKDLHKEIRLFNQVPTYKYFSNFERDDIEIIIDDQIVSIDFIIRKSAYYSSEKRSELENNLNADFYYYWHFSTKGIHTIKIIFKKKLLKCNQLFYNCHDIYKIDCSNFDCSQIIDCSEMFKNCYSLKEIELGNLDFALSSNFACMFENCYNLEKLDVSYFNTNKSKYLTRMFKGCSKLKEINVSNFKTEICQYMQFMFYNCSSLESIDMLNWDLKNIKKGGIDGLFNGCSSLKNIKLNFNKKDYFKDYLDLRNNKKCGYQTCFKHKNLNEEENQEKLDSEIFGGLPNIGLFIWKKGIDCNELLKLLAYSWNRVPE